MRVPDNGISKSLTKTPRTIGAGHEQFVRTKIHNVVNIISSNPLSDTIFVLSTKNQRILATIIRLSSMKHLGKTIKNIC